MAAIHRISEELFVDSFELIALHSNMESYAMAYHINRVMGLNLSRSEEDLEIGKTSFPLYEWKDTFKDQEWFLISNRVMIEEEENSSGLFRSDSTITPHYLIAEKKQINYILKIASEDSSEVYRAIEAIRNVPKISMTYQLDVEDLKSKRNLIF